MTVASLAVTLPQRESEATVWLGLVAFGEMAETLLTHAKGDMLSVSGRAQQSTWKAQDGTERDQLQILADGLHSAKTARPSAARRNHPPKPSGETP